MAKYSISVRTIDNLIDVKFSGGPVDLTLTMSKVQTEELIGDLLAAVVLLKEDK